MGNLEKPKVEFKNLDNIVIETPSEEGCKELIRICECSNLYWGNFNRSPTKANFWGYKEETCIHIDKGLTKKYFILSYGSKEFFLAENQKIISNETFYEQQGITPEKKAEINAYFESLVN